MLLKVLIVDDEEIAREALCDILGLWGATVELVGAYENITSAVNSIKEKKPDVVLLDVELGEEKGFDIFNHFPSPAFKVIFITAYEQYAVQAFRFAALDYLLKPVHPVHLGKAIHNASNAIDREKLALMVESFVHNTANVTKETKKVVLKTSENIHVVKLHEIMYCKADHSYTTFYLADRRHIMVSSTLGGFEEMFEGFDFIRIHQSYLVNLDYVCRYDKRDGGQVILKDGTSLPLATRKKDIFLQQLAKL